MARLNTGTLEVVRTHRGTWGQRSARLVEVQAAAIDGRANAAVLKALAKAFGVSRRQVRLVAGELNRTKLVEIDDDEASRLLLRLAELRGAGGRPEHEPSWRHEPETDRLAPCQLGL